MKLNLLTPLRTTAICAFLALGALLPAHAEDKKADPAGTWTWTTPGRDGAEGRKTTLKLKVEGEKVMGTVSMAGRDGQARETEITNGKIKGDEVSFDVTRENNNNKITTKYMGKVSGDMIKGKAETERDGQKRSRDWEAKREVKK
jgi:hypothetical protein